MVQEKNYLVYERENLNFCIEKKYSETNREKMIEETVKIIENQQGITFKLITEKYLFFIFLFFFDMEENFQLKRNSSCHKYVLAIVNTYKNLK